MISAIAAAALSFGQVTDFVKASDYFPLVPGTKWVYSDTAMQGAMIEQIVNPVFDPNRNPVKPDELSKAAFYPVEVRVNGVVTGKPCFRTVGNTLLWVGNSPNRLADERPILKLGGDQQWDYDADPISQFDPTPIHVKAHCKPGPDTNYFGKIRKTFVLTTDASVGGKKGLKVKQTAIYAEGVGMVRFDEEGTAGGKSLNHSRVLVKFEPKEGGI